MAQPQHAQPSHGGLCILTGSQSPSTSPLQLTLGVPKSKYSLVFQPQLKIQTEQDRPKDSHLFIPTTARARGQQPIRRRVHIAHSFVGPTRSQGASLCGAVGRQSSGLGLQSKATITGARKDKFKFRDRVTLFPAKTCPQESEDYP